MAERMDKGGAWLHETEGLAAELQAAVHDQDLLEQMTELDREEEGRNRAALEARRREKAQEYQDETLTALRKLEEGAGAKVRVEVLSTAVPGTKPIWFGERRDKRNPGRRILLAFNALDGWIRVSQLSTLQGKAQDPPVERVVDPTAPEARERLRQAVRWVVKPESRPSPF